ncbi:MAG TPA: proteasome subunit alpha [Kineosporiaceae bacterium]|nr:proteasome subunit alpha [Kineosporiaceae bacterium]
MTMPFYASPEQIMKDRADYARRNIARGRPVVALAYDGGIAFVTENPSRALHKISEIYDRIAFAATGRYNEFENLRVAGVRYADLRGYSYDRTDVTARGLANAYAQTLGAVFTTEQKPLEVELVVAEVGTSPEQDQIYRLTYDGSVADERGFVAIGGQADQIMSGLQEQWREGMTLSEALTLAVSQLSRDHSGAGARALGTSQLEVAILDRLRPRRAFRRLAGPLLERLLNPGDPTTDVPHTDDGRPGLHDTLTDVEPAPSGGGSATPSPTAPTENGDSEPGDHDLGGEG